MTDAKARRGASSSAEKAGAGARASGAAYAAAAAEPAGGDKGGAAATAWAHIMATPFAEAGLFACDCCGSHAICDALKAAPEWASIKDVSTRHASNTFLARSIEFAFNYLRNAFKSDTKRETPTHPFADLRDPLQNSWDAACAWLSIFGFCVLPMMAGRLAGRWTRRATWLQRPRNATSSALWR